MRCSSCEEIYIFIKQFMAHLLMVINLYQCTHEYPIIIIFSIFNVNAEVYNRYFLNVNYPIISYQRLISSTFKSDIYGLMWRILYLIFLYHTVIWTFHWSNTALYQMCPYMASHSLKHYYYQAWLYLQLCIHGQLFYYFLGIIFINLRLIFLAYKFPFHCIFYRENHITTKY